MDDEPARAADTARAIEANAAAALLAIGRAGGGDERDEGGLCWTIGGSPLAYHNAVVRADLAPEAADAAIDASIAALRARGVPGSWHVGPSMRPADLGARLAARGFVAVGDEPAMALDLAAPPAPAPPPPRGLGVALVRDERALGAWGEVLSAGFDGADEGAAWVIETFRRLGWGESSPFRHFVARFEWLPVATGSLFLHEGVAGIYFVFTSPRQRRRGVAAALTRALLDDARALGARLAVLHASEMGYGVYRRLGFREYGRLRRYEWSPGSGPSERARLAHPLRKGLDFARDHDTLQPSCRPSRVPKRSAPASPCRSARRSRRMPFCSPSCRATRASALRRATPKSR
ncbi:MAG TPA: GNAT family N-acetyltransferase [Polyangiaceae bacterium]|nr:GNAT family N-acetyltransferase [Polyangiaceae bacterium]